MLGLAALLVSASLAGTAHAGEPSPTKRKQHSFPTKAERGHPPLVIAGGPLIGPHAIGNQECRSEEARCETNGAFFGFGVTAELRGRIYKILYGHLRPFFAPNVSTNSRVYRGIVGGGVGLGVYGHHIFARGEYILLHAYGDNTFAPPFFDAKTASDTWGKHAGMLAVGFRKQVARRVGLEFWGGPMFGPRSIRRFPTGDVDRRALLTFMVGVGVSFDAVVDPSAAKRPARSPGR